VLYDRSETKHCAQHHRLSCAQKLSRVRIQDKFQALSSITTKLDLRMKTPHYFMMSSTRLDDSRRSHIVCSHRCNSKHVTDISSFLLSITF
jgi:hypothetical protein